MYKTICKDDYEKRLPALKEAYNKLPDEYKKYFAVPKLLDLEYVADNLIEEHKNELGLLGEKLPPREALNRSFMLSTTLCLTLVDEGEIMGIGGIGGSNSIWLLLCKDAPKNKAMQTLLTKDAKPLLDYFLREYADSGFLENAVSPESLKQQKWLKYLGAVITPIRFGNKDVVVFTFVRDKEKGCDN